MKSIIYLYILFFCIADSLDAQVSEISDKLRTSVTESVNLKKVFDDVMNSTLWEADGNKLRALSGSLEGQRGIINTPTIQHNPICAAYALAAFKQAMFRASAKKAFIQSVNVTIDLFTAYAKVTGASDLVKQLLKASMLATDYWNSNSEEEFKKKIIDQLKKQLTEYMKGTGVYKNLSDELKGIVNDIKKTVPGGTMEEKVENFFSDFDKSSESYLSKSLGAIYLQMTSLKTREILDDKNVKFEPCSEVKVHIWTEPDVSNIISQNGGQNYLMYLVARGKCNCLYPTEPNGLKDWYVKVMVPVINPEVLGNLTTETATANFKRGDPIWEIHANCGCTTPNYDTIPLQEYISSPTENENLIPHISPQERFRRYCEEKCSTINDKVDSMVKVINDSIEKNNDLIDTIESHNKVIRELYKSIEDQKTNHKRLYDDLIDKYEDSVKNFGETNKEHVKKLKERIKELIKARDNIDENMAKDLANKQKQINGYQNQNAKDSAAAIKSQTVIAKLRTDLKPLLEEQKICWANCEKLAGKGPDAEGFQPPHLEERIKKQKIIAVYSGVRLSNEDSQPKFNTTGVVVGAAVQVAKKISVNANIGITSGSNNGVKYNKTTIVTGSSFYPLGTTTNKSGGQLKVIPSITVMAGTSILKSSASGFSATANSFTYQINGDVQFPVNLKIPNAQTSIFVSAGLLHTSFYSSGQSNINVDAGIKVAFGK